MPPLGLLGVPTAAGAHSPGIDKAPRALRDAGLVERLRERGLTVEDHGDLPHVPFRIDRDHRLAQNVDLVVEVAREVADRTADIAGSGAWPLVVGGDCTILIGTLAGWLAETGSLGLVYLDAHPDLNTPSEVVQGALDWMGMAHVLGAPGAVPELSHIGPRFPLLAWDQVVFLAYVESEVTRGERALLAGAARAYASTVVAGHADHMAARSARWLERRVSRFVVHFDVDVIDFVDFPIADNAYQRNQGLTLADAMLTLATLARNKAFGGVVVTQVNPDHAAGQGPLLEEFSDRLAAALSGAAEA